MKLVTLGTIRKGDWLIKASCFDEQILIFIYNECIMFSKITVFFCEEKAHNYIESLHDDYTNY